MAEKRKSSSLFDDIFRLQNTAPELDVDPEDLVDGLKPSLVEGVDAVETFQSSSLRRQAAIIPDDPKYKGKKASRKDLFSDDDDNDEGHYTDSSQDKQSDNDEEMEDDQIEDSDTDDEDQSEANESDDENDEADVDDGVEDIDKLANGNKVSSSAIEDILPLPNKSDDIAKGKVVMHQLSVWDDLIKSRIALQKMVTACNRLPQSDTWADFDQHLTFHKEAKNVHSSVRKLLSTLLDLQLQLLQTSDKSDKSKSHIDGSDEEITSESEEELDKEVKDDRKPQDNDTREGDDDNVDANDGDSLEDDLDEEEMATGAATGNKQQRGRLKRKLDVGEVEETLKKRHKDFQSFRNDTLSKWDEKTRLTRSKIKAKNFAAFEVSVLKQIEQVLVNRERLVKRLHQQRSTYRILGQSNNESDKRPGEDDVVDDDDDDVEVKLRHKTRQDSELNPEIIDDNDFYHVCLRDLIEMKQNEETDPVMANKQWLEIQRLRNKQKRKVDTRASKGRKIRYHVKEKLKNYMAPYDKSAWTDEQKDDLFKALFGGNLHRGGNTDFVDKPTINLGI